MRCDDGRELQSLRTEAHHLEGHVCRSAPRKLYRSEAFSALDRAAKMGAIHTGKADRTKRRLAALTAKSA